MSFNGILRSALYWKLVSFYILLFSLLTFSQAFQTATVSVDWEHLNGSEKFKILNGCFIQWGLVMLSFFNKSIARMDQNQSPIADTSQPFPPALKLIVFVLLVVSTLMYFCGCAIIPDGVNYTAPFDQRMKSQGHWFGLSWTIRK